MDKNTPEQKSSKRRQITQPVRYEILREAGYMCANPRCRHILTLELHHIVWVKEGGTNDPANLVALCPNCHALHTRGHIPQTAVQHWKGILHALNGAFTKESIDLLVFLYKVKRDIWYSGDGLLKFASLIAGGYAKIQASEYGDGMESRDEWGGPTFIVPPSSSHRVVLTQKGEELVDYWLTGDKAQNENNDSEKE